mmetsp:Transcript_50424/g.42547  ORF Transcript_50424/g.42547 Transcript_50424/m.42547 type:complete len:89 (-) Transcript_50424:99-365(-)
MYNMHTIHDFSHTQIYRSHTPTRVHKNEQCSGKPDPPHTPTHINPPHSLVEGARIADHTIGSPHTPHSACFKPNLSSSILSFLTPLLG